MKKAILFDLDNTLYDYEPVHKKALDKVYKVFNRKVQKISKEKFLKFFKLSKSEIHKELSGTASSHNRVLYFQRLIEKTHNTVDPKMILRLYNAYWDNFLRNMKLKKDVIKTFKEIRKKGLKIALVSDLTTNIQLRKIKKLKLTPYVDYLVTSEEAGSEKPHAIMFLTALNKLDIKPSEAIMVGDNEINDILGANSVEMDTILISNEKRKKKNKEDNTKPNYYIQNIPEILEILKK